MDNEGSSSSILGFKPTTLKTELFKRNRIRVKEILYSESKGEALIGQQFTVCGWTRTVRQQQKNTLAFIALNDGSCFDSLQVVASKEETKNFDDILSCGGIGSSMKVLGEIVESPNKKNQLVEMKATEVIIFGKVDPMKYPFKKTKHAHSLEFLRENAHLRSRTNLIGAVARVRNAMAYATHLFFQNRGFLYIHTPVITASDGEGAGEMFAVTTVLDKLDDCKLKPKQKKKQAKPASDKVNEDLAAVSLATEGSKEDAESVQKQLASASKFEVDYNKDFFSRPAFLTVTGQLNVEAYAVGLSDCYTFGPTFRAENSHTSRHLAEFWMIEPELSFSDLKDCMDVAEDYLKFCIQFALENCAGDLKFFEQRVEKGLLDRLKNVSENAFIRLTYTEAIEILNQPEHLAAGKFEEKPYWGIDLGSEHERYLTEQVYHKPVVIVNYPASFKAFYMKRNPEKVTLESGEVMETVQGMDILVPKIGEIIGGSVREENLEVLEGVMEEKGLDKSLYNWYLDLRRFGTVPHAGFGVGFERLIMFVTGVENIRDVIPFPRAPGQCEF